MVYMPTALGFIAFGSLPAIEGTYENKADAEEACYLANADEPAPDKYDYARYEIVPPIGSVR